ncbi:MAG: TRAP transporter substrate-binding protein [Chloroflexota bacterium]
MTTEQTRPEDGDAMRRLTRRSFLSRGVVLGVALPLLGSSLAACSSPAAPAATSAPAAAATGAKKVLKCGMLWNTEMAGYKAILQMNDILKQKSNGSLEMQFFPAEQLGPAPEEIEAVKIGAQDMFAEVTEWFGTYVKDYSIFGAAFFFRDLDHVVKVASGPIGQGMAEQLRTQHGIYVLDQSSPEPARNLLSRKAILSAAEIQGVKMRVPQIPTYFDVWKAIGANPTPIPWADIYTALQGGVVDAMEGTIPDIFPSRFGEVIKHMSMTNHLVSTAIVIINEKVFKGLGQDQQKALVESAQEFAKIRDKLTREFVQTAIDGMKAQGVQFHEDVDRKGFMDKGQAAIVALEKAGTWSAGLYDKVQAVK